jgi:hypothetical protein
MVDTTFVPGTPIVSPWLNDVNDSIYFNPLSNYVAGTIGYVEKSTIHIRMFSGFVGDGVADDTVAVQSALNFMSLTRGKGIINAEGCRIRLTAKITIPSWVLFRGAEWIPDPSNTAQTFATALYIDWGAGADNHAVEMSHSSGIEGFTFFYPGQVAKTAATPVAFGYAISTPLAVSVYDNIHIKNITLYNAYKGIRLNRAGRFLIENVQGDPLFMGMTADQCLDVCRIENVHFWNFYTQGDVLETWVAANATAYEFFRVDQLFGSKMFAWNYNIGFHCRDGLWANFTDIAVDKANTPFLVEQSTQIDVKGFVFICNPNVKPAIWGRFIGESCRFTSGRITSAASVGAQIDDGASYTFENVEFDCVHASVVNLSASTEVRVGDTCRWNVPPLGTYNTAVNGERLPKTDNVVALPAPTLVAGASAVAGGWRFPLSAVANPAIYFDLTGIDQRTGMHILEFDYDLVGGATTWYFHCFVGKDVGTDKLLSIEPLSPLILNTGSVTKKIRIPFHINQARFRTVAMLRMVVTSATPGAYLDLTNFVLYDQANRYTTDAQVSNMMRNGYCLDPYGVGQTLYAKGKGRRIICEPEGAGVGRLTVVPTSQAWVVGDQIEAMTPVAGASPGVVCTTAGTPGTWKAMASLAP